MTEKAIYERFSHWLKHEAPRKFSWIYEKSMCAHFLAHKEFTPTHMKYMQILDKEHGVFKGKLLLG